MKFNCFLPGSSFSSFLCRWNDFQSVYLRRRNHSKEGLIRFWFTIFCIQPSKENWRAEFFWLSEINWVRFPNLRGRFEGAFVDLKLIAFEAIGWISTITFLISIILPQRKSLHVWGMFTSITTGVYAYHHGATAIWVKWVIAFFFHTYMWVKLKRESPQRST